MTTPPGPATVPTLPPPDIADRAHATVVDLCGVAGDREAVTARLLDVVDLDPREGRCLALLALLTVFSECLNEPVSPLAAVASDPPPQGD